MAQTLVILPLDEANRKLFLEMLDESELRLLFSGELCGWGLLGEKEPVGILLCYVPQGQKTLVVFRLFVKEYHRGYEEELLFALKSNAARQGYVAIEGVLFLPRQQFLGSVFIKNGFLPSGDYFDVYTFSKVELASYIKAQQEKEVKKWMTFPKRENVEPFSKCTAKEMALVKDGPAARYISFDVPGYKEADKNLSFAAFAGRTERKALAVSCVRKREDGYEIAYLGAIGHGGADAFGALSASLIATEKVMEEGEYLRFAATNIYIQKVAKRLLSEVPMLSEHRERAFYFLLALDMAR